MIVSIQNIPKTMSADQFVEKYMEYRQSMIDHSKTEGVPAPFPEYEIFRVLYERGIENIEFDKRELALREIALMKEAEMIAQQKLEEDRLILQETRKENASEIFKTVANEIPVENIQRIIDKDHEDALIQYETSIQKDLEIQKQISQQQANNMNQSTSSEQTN